jgi:hypothetical protein
MPSRWQESGHLHTFWHRTAMTFLIIVAIVAVLAGALASVAGFGIGTCSRRCWAPRSDT